MSTRVYSCFNPKIGLILVTFIITHEQSLCGCPPTIFRTKFLIYAHLRELHFLPRVDSQSTIYLHRSHATELLFMNGFDMCQPLGTLWLETWTALNLSRYLHISFDTVVLMIQCHTWLCSDTNCPPTTPTILPPMVTCVCLQIP